MAHAAEAPNHVDDDVPSRAAEAAAAAKHVDNVSTENIAPAPIDYIIIIINCYCFS